MLPQLCVGGRSLIWSIMVGKLEKELAPLCVLLFTCFISISGQTCHLCTSITDSRACDNGFELCVPMTLSLLFPPLADVVRVPYYQQHLYAVLSVPWRYQRHAQSSAFLFPN